MVPGWKLRWCRRWRTGLAVGALAICPSVPANAAKPVYWADQRPSPNAAQLADSLRAVPASLPGFRRYVFHLPPQPDEDRLEVELVGGKDVFIDSALCLRPFMDGEFQRHDVQGSFPLAYWVLTGKGQSVTLMAACFPPRPPATVFIAAQPARLRYDSRTPQIVFVPSGLELRYRVLTRGPLRPVPAD